LIGIACGGKPIAGIVNQPFFTQNIHDPDGDRVIWAIDGLGAFHNSEKRDKFEKLESLEKKLKESEERKKGVLAKKYQLITTRSHLTEIVKNGLENIPNCELIHRGGSGYKTLCVIEGSSDCYLYPRNGTKRWDTCAPEAILRALGGRFTDVFNNQYDYSAIYDKNIVENWFGFVATIVDHDYFLNNLNKDLLENVKKIHKSSIC
jgi:3'(2'), 5'-bisphosphate nucleotidase